MHTKTWFGRAVVSDMGKRLALARMTAGYTTAELFATRLRVHPGRYRKWERGESVPPPDMLILIAEETGITLDWLIRGKVPAKQKAARQVAAVH